MHSDPADSSHSFSPRALTIADWFLRMMREHDEFEVETDAEASRGRSRPARYQVRPPLAPTAPLSDVDLGLMREGRSSTELYGKGPRHVRIRERLSVFPLL